MGSDYKMINVASREQTGNRRGGQNKQVFLMNLDTFKCLCLKAKTPRARIIQDYYIKVQNNLFAFRLEELEELRRRVQVMNNSTPASNAPSQNSMSTPVSQPPVSQSPVSQPPASTSMITPSLYSDTKTFTFIQNCFKDIYIHRLYPFDPYRVDLFIESYDIVVEREEFNDDIRVPMQVITRDQFLLSNGVKKIIRYNPNEDGFTLSTVINEIGSEILNQKEELIRRLYRNQNLGSFTNQGVYLR
jgi:very-short-patch-repair endonuclease